MNFDDTLVVENSTEIEETALTVRPLFPEEKAVLKARERVLKAQSRRMEAEASVAEIKLAQEKRQEEAYKASDSLSHTFYFVKKVDSQSVGECIDRMNYWVRTQPDRAINIIFFSNGGDVVTGMALFDFIGQLRKQGIEVNTSVLGQAASMAAVILQAGTRRTMGREAWLMIHEGGIGFQGTSGQAVDTMEWYERLKERICTIFVERASEAKVNGTASKPITEKRLTTGWKRKDWWIDSKEALELGLVDEIV